MKTVSIQELKLPLTAQIGLVEAGDEILITRHGRPVARLAPVRDSRCRPGARFGTHSILPAIQGGVAGRALEILQEDRGDRLDGLV